MWLLLWVALWMYKLFKVLKAGNISKKSFNIIWITYNRRVNMISVNRWICRWGSLFPAEWYQYYIKPWKCHQVLHHPFSLSLCVYCIFFPLILRWWTYTWGWQRIQYVYTVFFIKISFLFNMSLLLIIIYFIKTIKQQETVTF